MEYDHICRVCEEDLEDAARIREKHSLIEKMRGIYDIEEGFENDPPWAPKYLHNRCHSKILRVTLVKLQLKLNYFLKSF